MPTGDFPAHPLEPSEALLLVQTPNPRYRTGSRDRAVLAMMWRCGLRNSEVRNLDVEHLINEGDRGVRIMRPKGFRRGKKPRNVGVDETTWGLVEAWLDVRGRHPGVLFDTRTGARINDRQLRRMVAYRARCAGITRRVHPHALRHTYARALYDEGIGMVHIQKALGHGNLGTTANYLESIGATEVVAITSSRTWSI